ncbi:class I SAM-dependent methyltransferase [Paenibacillus psychroresistens]|uniref:Class I SAM-dependent methyltransferase n=1 Tax=Paenibacillus psychroresistens TaxID=1778678 RepID=A0A6B8RJP8_9BACL|nr:class I SAM-dependent methyltransferase [Paenibacillus psychroresistens]QGQ96490.1 class I SAM-dependent methyltransferase [Paenibacillus psychroresistens]
MSSIHKWQPELYDNKLGFVSQFGKGVVELLNPQSGERILDLGCGTGDLSSEISKCGAKVVGMDLSATMIEQAKRKYPDIDFVIGNAEEFEFKHSFDAVFSNASLHWIKNAAKVISCVKNALAKDGRFVVEFGGKGNVEKIVEAISKILARDYGIDASAFNPWYFPSIGEYSNLLEQMGFRVTYAVHFDRSTKLEDGENGLNIWLAGLAADEFFKGFSESERTDIFNKVSDLAKKDLFIDGIWYADYKRLRIVAWNE